MPNKTVFFKGQTDRFSMKGTQTSQTWKRARRALVSSLVALALMQGGAGAAHAAGCGNAATMIGDIWQQHGVVISTLPYGQYAQVVAQMISFWNSNVANGSWPQIGQRKLLRSWGTGTIVGPGTRLWVQVAPLEGDGTLEIEKIGGRGETEAALCRTDVFGNRTKIRDWTFDSGDLAGTVKTAALVGAPGFVYSVHFVGQSVLREFEYKIRAH